MLYGNTGVGKTFLTNCIAKELLDRSYTVVYLTSLKLFDILETYKFDRELSQEEKNASISYILNSDLLIIDDLGTEFQSSYSTSTIYNIFNSRLLNRKPTIMNTNLTLKDLEKSYSPRFVSRVMGNCAKIDFLGRDIRRPRPRRQ